MIGIVLARLEAGHHARREDLFAGIRDQHHFSFQHVDKFVLALVPMPH